MLGFAVENAARAAPEPKLHGVASSNRSEDNAADAPEDLTDSLGLSPGDVL